MEWLQTADVTYYQGTDLQQSKNIQKSMVRMHISHINQIHYKDSGESVPISVVNYNTDEYILDHTHTHTHTVYTQYTSEQKTWRTYWEDE